MGKRFGLLGALLVLVVATAEAQDAKAVLQSVSTAIGAGNLKSIQYSGTGYIAAVGQNFSLARPGSAADTGVDEDWPRFDLKSYTRTIDYDAKSAREELTRIQGNNAPTGGGGTPLQGEQQQLSLVNGNYAWNLQGTNVVPQPAAAEMRQFEIWLTPHGFIKAAMQATDAKAVTLALEGSRDQAAGKYTFVTFKLGKFRVIGQITDKNLIERVQTWVSNPVMGDMLWEVRYTDYRDYGGVKFPARIHTHQGFSRGTAGHNYMEVRVTAAQPNLTVAALTVPDSVRQASIPAVRAESKRLANGVWLIAGGSHNSVAVEFRDFVAVIEAPQNEARSLAVIAEVQKLVPNKRVRYVVNTHHHFDHSGGIRTYVAQSATVVTHESNLEFYEEFLLNVDAPRTLEPDLLSTFNPWFTQNRSPDIETVKEKFVISDGVRVLDLYHVQNLNHAASMLIAYLPAEKILVNADLYTPPAPGAPQAPPSAAMTSLYNNIQRLKLDVSQHVPIHGDVGTHADFLRLVGKSSN